MIKLNNLTLKKSINKAYLKVKPVREDFEKFKEELKKLLTLINDKESEEHNKNFVRDFLINTFYSDKYVNTSGRTDLAIHLDRTSKSLIGVIIEAKSPANKYDMIFEDNLNCKAMHEVILYYLRERIDKRNDEIKNIIITNSYKWIIFNADQFEKQFYKSKLKNEYLKWRDDKKVSKLNEHFYNEIVKKFLDESNADIEAISFDLRDLEKNLNKKDEKHLIPLFKKLSPPELLKEPFANDSNTLNKQFYSELLHIIGLEEYKEGSKKKIGRKDENKRNSGSLLENTIRMLNAKNVIKNFDDISVYGSTEEEQLYNIALELNIVWINRIMFLKLLEAQLVNYHSGDKNYKFLEPKVISQYDDLFELFHEVLAVKTADRNPDLIGKFNKIPYLNSSLFELSEIEKKTIDISSLKDKFNLPFYKSTVFSKDIKSKSELPALEYLLLFLDAYDFASEGGEEILEERKTIMNASVLGLIFEKINGYKEGSFYTPGFITMYMARETLRRAVVQKFNETKSTTHKDYEELKKNINTSSSGREEANKIINELKICDPAVGSGHFLVSCLNEIIAIKADLKVLNYRDGRQVQNFSFEIENDELVINNEETDELFGYHLNPSDKPIPTLHELQEALFHEKETVIENCLFGVDINPNSVNICRLRLWIELLKNSYYTSESNYTELETLPNIDINIKQGNSLISRFDVRQDIFTHADKQTLDVYKMNVTLYKNVQDRDKRRELKNSIDKTKERFRGIAVDPLYKVREQREKLTEQLHKLNVDNPLFKHEDSAKKEAEVEKKRSNLSAKISKLSKEIEDKAEEYRTIYSNSFEWRFEFPEVLDDDGNFAGFDIVIGNPPYIPLEGFSEVYREFFKKKYSQFKRKFETSVLFIVEGFGILKPQGILTYIAPVTWQTGENYQIFRKYLFEQKGIIKIINLPFNIFADAYVDTAIYIFSNDLTDSYSIFSFNKKAKVDTLEGINFIEIEKTLLSLPKHKIILNPFIYEILNRLDTSKIITIGEITISTQGLAGSNFESESKVKTWHFPFLSKGNVYNYSFQVEEIFYTSLEDKPSLKVFYESKPKLLIRRIVNRQDRLSVGYTEARMVFKKDINPFIPVNDDFHPKYLLALMASKFISFIYLNISSIATKDDFRQTTLAELREIPIPIIPLKEQKSFIQKADKILEMKVKDLGVNTSKIEKEIDEMVYKLYGLTEEEIKIFED
ncbi:MAG: Eco57I restriction-modification methylase domain-containing protein [Bacteroidetes bacterium]|nr:Eco57I restriction-modification methylase domain-containing protein [Bacteroidota bacterium]